MHIVRQKLSVGINKTLEMNIFELRLKHTHCFSSSFVCSLSWCVDNLNGFHRNITAITNLMCVSSYGATVCSKSKMNTDSLVEKMCQYCFAAVWTFSLEYKKIFLLLRKSWRRHVCPLRVFITLMSDSGCSSALTEKFPVFCFRPDLCKLVHQDGEEVGVFFIFCFFEITAMTAMVTTEADRAATSPKCPLLTPPVSSPSAVCGGHTDWTDVRHQLSVRWWLIVLLCIIK